METGQPSIDGLGKTHSNTRPNTTKATDPDLIMRSKRKPEEAIEFIQPPKVVRSMGHIVVQNELLDDIS
ncbi:hypothetical protein E3N88_28975 [Mikania micrantha]|uniref:Uncharacterized protein n=1 Tax=Mikania micrantha TaxID=192012 RepID=A0A5N6N2P9_9ASTR|nr:hypothetical protein E3N88_28975 [Mikania micrantha]